MFHNRTRFHGILRFVARLLIVLIVGGWLFLYLESIYQRRKAEAFIADLKSFNFTTAGFDDVRDLMLGNGGKAIQLEWLPRLPDFGTPMMPDMHGNVRFQRPGPTCTPQDCTFEMWIATPLAKLPLLGKIAGFVYTALPYLGIRSWILSGWFHVRDGKLERSNIAVGEIRVDNWSSFPRMIPFGYQVTTVTTHSNDLPFFERNQPYVVRLDDDHPANLPQNLLHTRVLQNAGAVPFQRAFDIDLHCLNGIFRGCRFDELAPSAWTDYSAKNGPADNRFPGR